MRRSPQASTVARYIAQHALLQEGKPVLVACSGGPDSVALVHILQELGYPLALAHCNFQLRGEESNADEQFVVALAQRHALPVYTTRFSTEAAAKAAKESIQVAARRLRYDFLLALCAKHKYQAVVTAHHADDVAETLIYSLLRSKTPQVLQGIPPISWEGRVRRPLLTCRKTDLLIYLENLNIPYRTDSSNLHTDYLRNHIRHVVLPALQTIAPDPAAQLIERYALYQTQEAIAAQWLRETCAKYVLGHWPTYKLLVAAMLQDHGPEKTTAMLHYFLREQAELDYDEVNEVLRLLEAQTGKQILTAALAFTRQGDMLVGMRRSEAAAGSALPPIALTQVPHTYTLGPRTLVVSAYAGSWPPPDVAQHAYLDADKLQGILQARIWLPGDKIVQPHGLHGSQKVSDVLTNKKISGTARTHALVLTDDAGIVYVEHYRIAARVAVGPDTKQVLRVVMDG